MSPHLDVSFKVWADGALANPRSKQSKSIALRVILVLIKADISGPARTTSWTSFLNTNYPSVPVVPVEAYTPKSSLTVEQGHTQDVHEQLFQPPRWVTTPRPGDSEEERLQRIDRWTPRVKTVIDLDAILNAKGKLVGKAVGGAAAPKERTETTEVDEGGDGKLSDSEEEQMGDAYEWKEPEFLTIGVIGQPNVGKSSLLNAIFGTTRVRGSRTPGKTTHFQTFFWTSDVRLVDCSGLVIPSFVPMDIQVSLHISISRAGPFKGTDGLVLSRGLFGELHKWELVCDSRFLETACR